MNTFFLRLTTRRISANHPYGATSKERCATSGAARPRAATRDNTALRPSDESPLPSPLGRLLRVRATFSALVLCQGLTLACGDDFSADEAGNAESETSGASDTTPIVAPNTTKPTEPTKPSGASKPDAPTGDEQTAPGGGPDASGPAPLPPPDDAAPGADPESECGGEGRQCCAGERCRPGLACERPSPDVDATEDASVGATEEAEFICTSNPRTPPRPGTDSDAGVVDPPPMPPVPEGDAAAPEPPGMPPGPGAAGDAGPPRPPGMPEDPRANCGREGDLCCKGPGKSCDEGLRCDNPNGPDLDDSECVPGR